jgi:hypothetical protein
MPHPKPLIGKYKFFHGAAGQTKGLARLRAAVTKSELPFTGAEISGTSSSDFSDDYNNNAPCGNTSASSLLPGRTCQTTVSFDPSKTGTENASYKVFDNTVGGPQTLSLTGKGQQRAATACITGLRPPAIFLVCERGGTHKDSYLLALLLQIQEFPQASS